MRHCERSEAIQACVRGRMDCFVARAPRNDGCEVRDARSYFVSGQPESLADGNALSPGTVASSL